MIRSKRKRCAEHVAHMMERRGAHRVLVGKPLRKTPLGRHRLRWEDNIKMDLQEVGWEHGLDQSCSEYKWVACSCKCGNEPSSSIICRDFLD
jgi:hypothetical protein